MSKIEDFKVLDRVRVVNYPEPGYNVLRDRMGFVVGYSRCGRMLNVLLDKNAQTEYNKAYDVSPLREDDPFVLLLLEDEVEKIS
jgi:hypothetical protein